MGVAYTESNSLHFVDVLIKKGLQCSANVGIGYDAGYRECKVGIACKFMLFSYRISVDKMQLLP